MINFHSPIRVWRSKNRIIIKIECIEVLLSVSLKKQPILEQITKLQNEYKQITFEEVASNVLERYASRALLKAESAKRISVKF